MARRLFAFSFLLIVSSHDCVAGSWSFTLPASSGAVSATESDLACTLNGTATRYATGYVRLSFNSCTGSNCDTCFTSNPRYHSGTGTLVAHGIELPGFGFWGEPLLYFENRLIQSIATGGRCPGEHWIGNYFFLSFNPKSLPSMTSLQPLFGNFFHDGPSNTTTISTAFSIYNGGSPTYDPFPMGGGLQLVGNCVNGMTNISGMGDRGGRLLMSPASGAIFATNGNKMVYVLPRIQMDLVSEMDGTWSGFMYQNTGTQNPIDPGKVIIPPIPVLFENGIANSYGYRVTDIPTKAVNANDKWLLTVALPLNNPLPGTFKMQLTHNNNGVARTASGICGIFHSIRSTMICIASDPDNTSQPLNMIFTSNAQRFPAGAIDKYAFGSLQAGGLEKFDLGAWDDGRGATMNDFGRINIASTKKLANNRTVMSITRLSSSGQIDTYFGDGVTGIRDIDFNTAGGNNAARAMVFTSARELVIAGGGSNGTAMYPALARVGIRGELDTTYNGTGMGPLLIASGVTSGTTFNGVGEDSQFRTPVCGGNNTTLTTWLVARYSATGALDISFNSTGYKLSTFDTETQRDCNSLVVQADNKIVTVGFKGDASGQKAVVARYTASGGMDVFDGADGFAVVDTAAQYEKFEDVTLQTNGRILAVGTASGGGATQLMVARYYSSGLIDASFNSGGILQTGFGTPHSYGNSIAVQGNGKIVIAGRAHSGTNSDFGVMRLLSTGALDPTFANGVGYAVFYVDPAVTDEGANNVLIQADGKIAAVGWANNSTNTDRNIAVLRLWGN